MLIFLNIFCISCTVKKLIYFVLLGGISLSGSFEVDCSGLHTLIVVLNR